MLMSLYLMTVAGAVAICLTTTQWWMLRGEVLMLGSRPPVPRVPVPVRWVLGAVVGALLYGSLVWVTLSTALVVERRLDPIRNSSGDLVPPRIPDYVMALQGGVVVSLIALLAGAICYAIVRSATQEPRRLYRSLFLTNLVIAAPLSFVLQFGLAMPDHW